MLNYLFFSIFYYVSSFYINTMPTDESDALASHSIKLSLFRSIHFRLTVHICPNIRYNIACL